MYECDICLAKIKKRNKNKHEKSMKHRYFLSNKIKNKYIVQKMTLINLKTFFNHTVKSIKRNSMNILYRTFGRKMM